MEVKLVSLQNIIESETKEDFNRNIKQFQEDLKSSFKCAKNEEAVKFLLKKAINNEKHQLSRTYFIMPRGDFKILGFFTLSLKVININKLDKKIKKKMVCTGKSPDNIDYIPAYLIGQLAKNDLYSQNKKTNGNIKNDTTITGEKLLLTAIDVIRDIQKLVGGKIILVDSVTNEKSDGKVVDFYRKYGFTEYSEKIKTKDGKILLPMSFILDDFKPCK